MQYILGRPTRAAFPDTAALLRAACIFHCASPTRRATRLGHVSFTPRDITAGSIPAWRELPMESKYDGVDRRVSNTRHHLPCVRAEHLARRSHRHGFSSIPGETCRTEMFPMVGHIAAWVVSRAITLSSRLV